jgi:hypothetical protein
MDEDSTLQRLTKIIHDALKAHESPFYSKPDFWIFIFLAILSIVVSVISIWVSRRANRVASEAELIVRRQNILLEISEAINICQTSNKILFEEMNLKISEVVMKIRHIIGQYRPLNRSTPEELLQQIQDCLESLQTKFYSLPSITPAEEINSIISPIFTSLVGNLSELQGNISINSDN